MTYSVPGVTTYYDYYRLVAHTLPANNGVQYVSIRQWNLVGTLPVLTSGSNGYVGIGTNAPSCSLDVSGSIKSSAAITATTTMTAPTISATTGIDVSGGTITNSLGGLTHNVVTGNGYTWQVGGTNKASLSATGLLPAVDNDLPLGQSGNRWSAVWAANGTIQTSDESEKDAVPLAYGLDDLAKVSTIKYKWKSQAALSDDDPDKNHEYFGVCAEELDALFPELVYNQQEPFAINYSELVPICINAIKELKKKNDALETSVATLVKFLRSQFPDKFRVEVEV
jgi:hypothetical protein